jgi:UDP-3-O-[3-hydroxymyristoyl] glucosamine N-acyltransferase
LGKLIDMQFPAPVSVSWIAEFINAEIIGKQNGDATGINEIHKVETGDLCFVDHPKYYSKCLESNATFIIINTKDVTIPTGKTILVIAEPFDAYLKIVQHFRPFVPQSNSISSTSIIGEGSYIMPNTFIGNHVKIGKNYFN